MRTIQILIPVLLAFCGACVCVVPVYSQDQPEETLSDPDSHETGQGRHGDLFDEWGGKGHGWKNVVSVSIRSTSAIFSGTQEQAERTARELEF